MTEKKVNVTRNVVWEHVEDGGRFMTIYREDEKYEDSKHHKLVAVNVSDEDAKVLVKQKVENNINSYLKSLPDEMRSPRMDAMIANMIRND